MKRILLLVAICFGVALNGISAQQKEAKKETKKESAQNKKEEKSETKLKKDGTPDMRFKENKEAEITTSGGTDSAAGNFNATEEEPEFGMTSEQAAEQEIEIAEVMGQEIDTGNSDINSGSKTNIFEVLSVVNIGAKKAKIITTHPSSSYKLVGEKTVEKIEILNSEDFWSSSKYLVIITE